MRYCQEKHYSDSGSLRKQTNKKNLFKEIMAENFPNPGTDKAYIKLYDSQIFNRKRFSWRDIIIYLSKVKDKQNFENCKVHSWRMFFFSCQFCFKVISIWFLLLKNILPPMCFVPLFILLWSQGFFAQLKICFLQNQKQSSIGLSCFLVCLISPFKNIPAYLVFLESQFNLKWTRKVS